MAGVEMLSIAGDGGERERLAVRLDLPTGRVRPAAILYLHGFGSRSRARRARSSAPAPSPRDGRSARSTSAATVRPEARSSG
jgi:hypothetical protein